MKSLALALCPKDSYAVFWPPHLNPLPRSGEETSPSAGVSPRFPFNSLLSRGEEIPKARFTITTPLPLGERKGEGYVCQSHPKNLSECHQSFIRALLAAATAGMLIASVASAQQQTDPRDVLPPTPQKPLVSGTLTAVTPATVQPPGANPVSVAPVAPAAPAPVKPGISQPAAVGANAAPASNNQSLTLSSVQSSPWDKSNATHASAWETTTNALSRATKPASDPWKTSPPSQNWNATPLLGSSGTKTEWK